MKHSVIFFCLAILWGAQGVFAQDISCADFSITGIAPGETNAEEQVISIQFDGGANAFIGYPHVALVVDADGDTLATGGIFFFGQLSGTTQEYPVTVWPDADFSEFTAMFIYGTESGEDTCFLSFPGSTSVEDAGWVEDPLNAWPNPSQDVLHVRAGTGHAGAGYRIFDASGRTVLAGRLEAGTTVIEWGHVPSGIYWISAGMSGKPVRVVRE